jgi:hypothetical protein
MARSTSLRKERVLTPVENPLVTHGEQLEEFLASHGGPFFELQLRLGLLRDNALRAPTRALLFIGIAWGAPLILSVLEGRAIGPTESHPYLLDLGAYARFLVAVGLFVLTEQQVEDRLKVKLAQFASAPLFEATSTAAAASAVATALRRRNSAVAEIFSLASAIAVSVAWVLHLKGANISSWTVQSGNDGASLTAAGWWVLVCSGPLFYFLLLRGLWRHLVWGLLLWKLASLELRLVATHPDGNGGLAFLAEYPNAYAMFIFGLSAVVAIALAKNVFEGALSSTVFGLITAIWLGIVLAIFAIPLVAFTRPLSELKERSLLLLGAQATEYHRYAERTLIGRNVVADGDQAREVLDTSVQFTLTRKLSVFLLSRAAVLPVAAAALAPFAVLGVEYLPYKEVISVVKKLLLL